MEIFRKMKIPVTKTVSVSLAIILSNCATPKYENINGMPINSADMVSLVRGSCKDRAQAVKDIGSKLAMTKDEDVVRALKQALNDDCAEVALAAEMAITEILNKTPLRIGH